MSDMEVSYTESELSLSPTQIMERLQVLRQLQLLQRGKIQKQRLQYLENSDMHSGSTEIVSHFSNSTSYNTFRSLLETLEDSPKDASCQNNKKVLQKVKDNELIEGVSVLNLSQESEFLAYSPSSSRSLNSRNATNSPKKSSNTVDQKKNSFEEIPILSPKKDFEALLIEKLQNELNKEVHNKESMQDRGNHERFTKKPFLRRGEGMSRFGLQKKDLVIQNTKSLPWRKKITATKSIQSPAIKEMKKASSKKKKVDIEILVHGSENGEILINSTLQGQTKTNQKQLMENIPLVEKFKGPMQTKENHYPSHNTSTVRQCFPPKRDSGPSTTVHAQCGLLGETTNEQEVNKKRVLEIPKQKHPLLHTKGKTWASVLNKEQSDFLQKLKQSSYYKNFVSPAKSTISDGSCDESKLRLEREAAEQNMFELLENKVQNDSFSLENSFFNRFFKRSQLECSGESTPVIFQHCLTNNPNLMRIVPNFTQKQKKYQMNNESCNDCTDCCSDTCSSVSSCCSCKTVEGSHSAMKEKDSIDQKNGTHEKQTIVQSNSKIVNKSQPPQRLTPESKTICDNDIDNSDSIKNNMVEMNAKLIATSELLKDRLEELENEIDTFRKENANLSKMREDIEAEKLKFYEEKSLFEQKINEEKILAEYYLADEKDKLNKQRQVYEKYIREMRGRINKKDKEEVVSLKKEISNLKEEIRIKDAKSTSTIARLRNHLKIIEKEKKDLHEEIEKLKKENHRIQHNNDITRRITNIKYLEQINKKLTDMSSKESRSEVNLDNNARYKTFEMDRQSRFKNRLPAKNRPMTRAKSVPNFKVTSRYAKYFSQRDVVSDFEKKNNVCIELANSQLYTLDNEESEDEISYEQNHNDSKENELEKLYMETFQSLSPKSNENKNSELFTRNEKYSPNDHDRFFILNTNKEGNITLGNHLLPPNNCSASNSVRSASPHSSKSLGSVDDKIQTTYDKKSSNISESILNVGQKKPHDSSISPVSVLTNRSSNSQKTTTVINKDYFRDTLSVSPEPTTSRSCITKTNLNPTEIKKPDGSKEFRFPNGNMKFISADGTYSKFVYYNGDIKENFYTEGRIKYYYAETKTLHTTHADGLEVLEFPDGQVEKRYKDGSTEIRLPNGSIRYFDPKNEHVREEWRFPDGTTLTVSAMGEQRITFTNGQVEVHSKDHKRREFPDGTIKLMYNDGTSETRYASGRIRIKDKHGNLIMDSSSR